MKKEKIKQELIMLFWLFVIGSFIGYIYEMIVVLVQTGHFESRQGLIYGPFTPVYGIGGIIYYLILSKIDPRNKVEENSKAISCDTHGKIKYYIKIFLITAILGGITEYVCSYVQEKAFGTISWDYSHLWFNLNGRTSLLHCTYWGIAGIMYVALIGPWMEKMKNKIEVNQLKIITIVLAILMLFNIIISCIAAERQEARRKNIPPNCRLDTFLDKHYPDEYMDKIFANKKEKF